MSFLYLIDREEMQSNESYIAYRVRVETSKRLLPNQREHFLDSLIKRISETDTNGTRHRISAVILSDVSTSNTLEPFIIASENLGANWLRDFIKALVPPVLRERCNVYVNIVPGGRASC